MNANVLFALEILFALEMMWQGMIGIFVVIGILALAVYLLSKAGSGKN